MVLGFSAATPPDLPIVFVRNNDIWVGGIGKTSHRVVKVGRNPTWSPDRKQIAFVRGNRVMVVHRDGTHLRSVFRIRKDQFIIGLSWGPLAYEPVSHNWPSGTSLLASISGSRTSFHVDIRVEGEKVIQTQEISLLESKWNFVPGYGAAAWAGNGGRILYTVNGDLWMSTLKDLKTEMAGWEIERVAPVGSFVYDTRSADQCPDFANRVSLSRSGRYGAYEIAMRGHIVLEVVWADFGEPKDDDLNEENKPPLLVPLPSEKHFYSFPSISPDGQWVLVTDLHAKKLYAVHRTGTVEQLVCDGEQGAW